MSIYPTAEQFQALLASDDQGPVVMVNLLRFKPVADESMPGLSGQEAYRKYGDEMVAFVESRGGRLIWSGEHRGNKRPVGSIAPAYPALFESLSMNVERNRYAVGGLGSGATAAWEAAFQ